MRQRARRGCVRENTTLEFVVDRVHCEYFVTGKRFYAGIGQTVIKSYVIRSRYIESGVWEDCFVLDTVKTMSSQQCIVWLRSRRRDIISSSVHHGT